jgi:hypothetical protein
MAKRFIITEEEKGDILSKYGLINEQDNYENHTFIKGIQRFLNEKIRAGLKVDGLSDNNLKSETLVFIRQMVFGVKVLGLKCHLKIKKDVKI